MLSFFYLNAMLCFDCSQSDCSHGLNVKIRLLSQVIPHHSMVLLLAVLVKTSCILSKFVTFCPSGFFIIPFLSCSKVP